MAERSIRCPDGCDAGRHITTGRLIESTDPDATGEYKDVCTCDKCGIIFYIVRERK